VAANSPAGQARTAPAGRLDFTATTREVLEVLVAGLLAPFLALAWRAVKQLPSRSLIC
jgi:hypothetical protein